MAAASPHTGRDDRGRHRQSTQKAALEASKPASWRTPGPTLQSLVRLTMGRGFRRDVKLAKRMLSPGVSGPAYDDKERRMGGGDGGAARRRRVEFRGRGELGQDPR